MKSRDIIVILGSRVAAAAANLGAVAVFTRMADVETYGSYILIFSYAFIAYGITAQWLHIAFFGLSRNDQRGVQISTLLVIIIVAVLAAIAMIAMAAASGVMNWSFAAAVCALTAGLAFYNVTIEIVRTTLQSRLLALVVLTRSVLLLPLGAAALIIHKSATSLAVGLALAYTLGSLPALRWIVTQTRGAFDVGVAKSFIHYGWPLLLSFGVMSIAQNADRILIGNLLDVAALAPYSAISDVLRQSFTVVGEAVALSIVSMARHEHVSTSGHSEKSRELLIVAFRTLAATALFIAAFFIVFGDDLVRIILGPSYRQIASQILPLMVAAYVIYTFRAFFFGQTIYFEASSKLELAAAIATIGTIVLFALLLAPAWGISGYAAAVVAAQIAAIAVFLVGDRSAFRMPVCWRSAAEAIAIGVTIILLCRAVDFIAGSDDPIRRFGFKSLIYVTGAVVAAWRLDPFSIRNILRDQLGKSLPILEHAASSRGDLLLIVKFPSVGGTQTLAAQIAAGLSARGFTVTVLYLYPSSAASAGQRLLGLARAAIVIVINAFQATVTFDGVASLLAGFVGWAARCPARVVHQTVVPSEVNPVTRWLDKIAGTIGFYTVNVTNSATTNAAFSNYPTAYRARIRLIPHGVKQPAHTLTREQTWHKFNVPAEGKILLNIGRLTDQKNQDVLFPVLREHADVRLVIAGDGPKLRQYRMLAESLGVADRLHLLGAIEPEDVADLLYACDVFVFPSVWESFGIAAVEAGLCGIPIVASDIPVLREVLADDAISSTYFVDPHSSELWSSAIRDAIQHTADNSIRRQDLICILRDRYAIDRMINRYQDILGVDRWHI